MKIIQRGYHSQVQEQHVGGGTGGDIAGAEINASMQEPVSFIDVLKQRAIETPEHPAYIFLNDGETEGVRLTYAQLDVKVRAIAAFLQKRCQPGDRVLMLYPAGMEYLSAFLACIHADIVSIPAYPPRNKRHLPRFQSIVEDASAKVVITTTDILKDMERMFSNAPELSDLSWNTTDDIAESLADSWVDPELTGDRLAFLQYTSGSTSAPKGVMLTHGNLMYNQAIVQAGCEHDETTSYVSWLPLFHDMGLGSALQGLYVGAPFIFMAPVAFIQQPVRWLRAISHYRAHTSGAPNFAYDLCVRKITETQCQGLDLSSWRVAFNGSEPVHPNTIARFIEKFKPYGFNPNAAMPCYGLAEATVAVVCVEIDKKPVVTAFDGDALTQHQVKAINETDPNALKMIGNGRTLLDDKMIIVDPETRHTCPPDRVGEIWLSSRSNGIGYWQKEEVSEETFRAYTADTNEGPYLRTGDMGFFYENELYVSGRIKDMVIIRGKNHYPQDIERTVEQSYVTEDNAISFIQNGGAAAFSVEIDDKEELVIVAEVDRRYQLVCTRLAKQMAQATEEGRIRSHKVPEIEENKDPWDVDPEDVIANIRRAITESHDLHVHSVLLLKMGGLPKTSSGKVQRSRAKLQFLDGNLATVWISELTLSSENIPQGDASTDELSIEKLMSISVEKRPIWLEKQLQQILARELYMPVAELDPGKPLNGFGLDSLTAVEFGHNLETSLGVMINEVDLLEGMTLRHMTAEVIQQITAPDNKRPIPLQAIDEVKPKYPLSHGQKSLWFLQELAPESRAYNVGFSARIHNNVDVGALLQAFQVIVDRHPSLRTLYGSEKGEPIQIVQESMPVFFTTDDVSDWSESEIMDRLNRDVARPFDLEKGPLLRVSLLSKSEEESYFLLSVHHIAIDLWSLMVMLDELKVLYSSLKENRDPNLSRLQFKYTDFIDWQSRVLDSEEGDRLWQYWRKQLAACQPVLDFPTDRPRPAIQTNKGSAHAFKLDAETSEKVKALAQNQGCTLFMFLLASFQLLIHRYTGQEDILVGTPVAGRRRAGLEVLMGYFVDSVVLRSRLDPNLMFVDYLSNVRETVLGALAHQEYPFSMLVERVHPARDPSRSPLFQSMFVLQRTMPQEDGDASQFILGENKGFMKMGDLEMESLALQHRVAMFDMMLTMAEGKDGINASFQFNTDLFESSTIAIMSHHFQTLVKAIVEKPEQRVSEISLMAPGDRYLLLVEWNDTGVEYPQAKCLFTMFDEQVARTPDAIAVVYESQRYMYWELCTKANQLANYLVKQGVGPEQLVGLCVERSVEMVIGIMGVLKAGGAYLPLDPEYPKERLAYMIEDSGIQILLSQENLIAELPEHQAKVICLDQDWPEIASESDVAPEISTTEENLAYVIYTSGSTGRPKGVMIPHRAIANHMSWMQETFKLTTEDAVLQKTPFSFDASVWEFFAPIFSGASLVMAKPGGHRDGQYMIETIKKYNITTLQLVPSLLRLLVNTPGFESAVSLKRVCCGGEVLAVDLQNLFHELSNAQLYNFYGPTECTIDSTFWPCSRNTDVAMIPIGRPISNLKIYILDKALNPVPVGVPGEIHIGGIGLAKGYLNRPDLTEERFIPDPFSDDENSKLYKAGDLGRYLHSGDIEYLGRMDHQVKLRGYRIELGEIESVMVKHEQVKECVVLAREDVPGDQRLVAYVVADPETSPEQTELREFLKNDLPDYMVPTDFVALDMFPLSPSGKVDRFALPAPTGTQSDSAYVAPNTPTELKLAEIWAEVLGAGRVGTQDNFFEFGGHSLLATQVISRIIERMEVTVPVRSIFETPTIAGLAERIDNELGLDEPIKQLPLERVSRSGDLPISHAQQRLWFVDRMISNGEVYNIPAVIRLQGDLRVNVLERTLHEVMYRHEVLRTHFIEKEGQPIPVLAEFDAQPLRCIDITDLPENEREDKAVELATADAKTAFQLNQGSLVRYQLIKLDQQDYFLIFNMHHIVSDGWSLGVLAHELNELYLAFYENKPSPLPALPVQYLEYAYWQKQWLDGEALEKQINYWKKQLSNGKVPALDLPTDRPRPHLPSYKGSHEKIMLPIEILIDLEDLSQQESASLSMTLLAAFNILLGRYADQEDIVLGYPVANRRRVEVEPLIGFFVNTLAIRTDLSADPDFRALLKRVREACFGAFANEDVPFEKMVETMAIERDPSRNPLFQSMFTMQNTPMEDLHLPDVNTHIVELDNGTAKFDLWLSLWERSDGLSATLEYSTDLFEAATIKNMLNHYQVLLQNIAKSPDKPISQLSLLSATERQTLLTDWNDTQHDLAPSLCIHHPFEVQVGKTPDAIAVVHGKHQLTYLELNEKSNQLAQHLRIMDVGPDVMVGIFMPPCLEMMISLLAVLKAGGAYVPMDTNYPSDRITYMMDHAKAPVLLTMEKYQQHLNVGSTQVVCLDTQWETLIEKRSRKNIMSGVRSDSMAYVIYTSGSTGKPKAAGVRHQGECNLLDWYTREFNMNANDKAMMISSFGFDLTQKNLFAPLWVGGQLILPEIHHYDNMVINNAIQKHKITLINCAPSAFYPLVTNNLEGFEALSSLRHVFLGGEPIVVSKLKNWLSDHECHAQIVNTYGPTECTDIAAFYRIENPMRFIDMPVPIGKPNHNVELYVLDDELNLLPVGVPGELCIGGLGVGLGYIGDPELTAKSFVDHPFKTDSAEKIYRTGDRVRYLADGNIEYLERMDDQVKLRGLRIELGEIETILRLQPGVCDVVVIVRHEHLIAYFVSDQETIDVVELKDVLRKHLPAYMIPGAFVKMAHLPISPNGKIDKKSLPDADFSDDQKEFVAPRNEVEQKVADIWAEVLKKDEIGVTDNFFELGGHSLLATQLISRIRQTFQVEPSLQEFFDDPTVAGFAGVIEKAEGKPKTPPPPAIKARPRKSRKRKDLKAKLEQLSDDELETLLKQKGLK